MHAGAYEILFIALLIIPTCLGLWREGKTNRHGVIRTLLERRRIDRRQGQRPLHDPRANYHYLGLVPPASPLSGPLDRGYDRRVAERRVEDAAYQSRQLLPQHSTVRVFAPTTRPGTYEMDVPALEQVRFGAERGFAAHMPGGADPA